MTTHNKWPNAPLIFVLAAIKISQYPNLQKRISDLHESVLEYLPKRHNTKAAVFSYSSFASHFTPSPQLDIKDVTRLYHPENGVSLFLRDDLIALELTQYNGFQWFEELTKTVVEAVLKALPSLRPETVAMRYLDAILDEPSTAESVSSFVCNELLGVSLPDYEMATLQSSQQFRIDHRQNLTISFLRGQKNSGLVVPDGIEIPSFLKPDRKLSGFIEHSGNFGLLDFDSGIQYEGEAKIGSLMEYFAILRSTLHDALPATATQAAMEYWKGDSR